jgi:hypothetical protein
MQDQNEKQGGPYQGWAAAFFGVAARPRTWLSLVYHVLAFPLGLAYFIFLVVGLSVGISLSIVMIGIPLLIATMLIWRLLARLERLQARALLGARVPSGAPLWRGDEGFWQNVKDLVGGSATWLDFVFLVLKFPIGLVSFVLTVTGLSVAVALVGAPVMQQFGWLSIGDQRIDSWPLSLLLVPFGVLAFFLWLHLMNGWGYVSRRLAEVLLLDGTARQTKAAAGVAAAAGPVTPPQWPPQQPWPVQQPWPPQQPPPQGWPSQAQPPQGWPPQPWPPQPLPPQAQPPLGWPPQQLPPQAQPPQGWPPQQLPPQAQPPWPPQAWPPQVPKGPPAPQGPEVPQGPTAPQTPPQTQPADAQPGTEAGAETKPDADAGATAGADGSTDDN